MLQGPSIQAGLAQLQLLKKLMLPAGRGSLRCRPPPGTCCHRLQHSGPPREVPPIAPLSHCCLLPAHSLRPSQKMNTKRCTRQRNGHGSS